MIDTDRRRADVNDTPDAVAPAPDEALIADEKERVADPESDPGVENIEKEGEPFGGNFA